MSREEVQKLLGGYATGTLTPEEQQALFAAALDDQELFDALAKEQPLRDLLRDPAAKAEVLAALDAPARGGWLAWMRRPWVAGLAMAGLAAVGVGIWRANRSSEVERPIVAELRRPETQARPQGAPQAPAEVKQEPPVAVEERQRPAGTSAVLKAPKGIADDLGSRRSDRREFDKVAQLPAAPAIAPAAPPPPASRDLKDSNAVALAQTGSGEKKTAETQVLNLQAGGQQGGQALTPSPMVNQQAMNQMGGNGSLNEGLRVSPGQAQPPLNNPVFSTVQASAPARKAEAAKGGGGGGGRGVLASPLRVQCSIVRDGDRTVDIGTSLDAGEIVKLRIVPNTDGFLYVMEGATTIVNAAVKANQTFETPALKSDGAGQRQLHITLSRVAITPGLAGAVGGVPASGFVDTGADAEAAKRAVAAGMFGVPQQVMMPVTLTWK